MSNKLNNMRKRTQGISESEKKKIAEDATRKAIKIMEERQAEKEMELLKRAYNSFCLIGAQYLSDKKDFDTIELDDYIKYMLMQFSSFASGHLDLKDIRESLIQDRNLDLTEITFL